LPPSLDGLSNPISLIFGESEMDNENLNTETMDRETVNAMVRKSALAELGMLPTEHLPETDAWAEFCANQDVIMRASTTKLDKIDCAEREAQFAEIETAYAKQAAIDENTEINKQILAEVKKGNATRESDVFWATYRAWARFGEPENEVEIEKDHRLKQEGWKWENIVLQVYPDSQKLSSKDFKKKVAAVKKQHQREYGQSQSNEPGWPNF